MKRHPFRLLPMLVALCMASACLKDLVHEVPEAAHAPAGTETDEGGVLRSTVQMALTVPGGRALAGPDTRSLDAVTQVGQTLADFRGITDLHLIPFPVRRTILPADERLRYIAYTDPESDAKGFSYRFPDLTAAVLTGQSNRSKLYQNVSVPVGTAAFLVYGKAIDLTDGLTPGTPAYKQANGALTAHGLDEAPSPADIWFEPELIWDGGDDGTASALAAYLTALATTTATGQFTAYYSTSRSTNYSYSESWATTTDPGLSALRHQFLNATDGTAETAEVCAGSGTGVAALLTQLYKSLRSYASARTTTNLTYTYWGTSYPLRQGSSTGSANYTQADLDNRLRDALLARIDGWKTGGALTIGAAPGYTIAFTAAAEQGYPGAGLPDGVAALRWNGSAFAVVSAGAGATNLAARDRFCYPPALYYYDNSRIDASLSEEARYETLRTELQRDNTWESILERRYEQKDAVVSTETRAVAIKAPVNYGPALLEALLEEIPATLQDADGKSLSVSGASTSFPVSGIIIGGQMVQNYNFTPSFTRTLSPHAPGTDFYLYDSQISGVYLRQTTPGAFHTLVLPTAEEADVYMAVEIVNRSGETFVGATGNILPDSKFYLVGQLDLSAAGQPAGETLRNTFVSDHMTTVKLRVKSLASAFNAIPDLSAPQLQLGVDLTLDWKQATSTALPLY